MLIYALVCSYQTFNISIFTLSYVYMQRLYGYTVFSLVKKIVWLFCSQHGRRVGEGAIDISYTLDGASHTVGRRKLKPGRRRWSFPQS